jgi:zinc protease
MIEKIIDMDSDRLLNLLLEPESVKREKKIVLEERRLRLENSVEGRLDELSWSLLVPTGPYGHPIIGSRESVSDANIEALRTWWRQNYHGGNLLITVAGDVKPAHILKVIKEKYGALPGPPKTPKPAIPAMLKPAVREATLPWDSVVVTLHFSYPTVPVGHPDTYALDLLSEILHESRASRLYSTFFRDYPIAQGLTGNHASYRGMGEFSSLIILRPGITKEDAVPLYLKTLDDMRREGPKPEELARVRRKLFMTFDHSARVIDQAALYLSLNELFLGDYRRWVTDFDAYEKVTPKDILAVMNKYIMPDNAVLVSVKPKRTLQ